MTSEINSVQPPKTQMGNNTKPSIALMRKTTKGLFGNNTEYFYEYTRNNGQVRRYKPDESHNSSTSLFEAFRQYSTKDDPDITVKELQVIFNKYLARMTGIGRSGNYDGVMFRKQEIYNQLNLAVHPSSDGGDKITVREQRDILDTWCYYAEPEAY